MFSGAPPTDEFQYGHSGRKDLDIGNIVVYRRSVSVIIKRSKYIMHAKADLQQ